MASLQYARVNKLIIYITMHKQKAPIYKLSRSKAPKQQILAYRHTRKTSELVLWYRMDVDFSNNFPNFLVLLQSFRFCIIYDYLVKANTFSTFVCSNFKWNKCKGSVGVCCICSTC